MDWDASRAAPKPEGGKSKGGKAARIKGNAGERAVAKATGGTRVPMSGAIKNSVHNLKGDVTVPDASGRPYLLIEVKVSGTIDPRGDKSFSMKKSVLKQATEEADSQNQIGAVRVHFSGDPVNEDWYVIRADKLDRFLDDAKLGASIR